MPKTGPFSVFCLEIKTRICCADTRAVKLGLKCSLKKVGLECINYVALSCIQISKSFWVKIHQKPAKTRVLPRRKN